MKRLVTAALILGGLSQAAGCVFVSGSDDPEGEFDVLWKVEGLDNQSGDGCAALDAVEVEIFALPVVGGDSYSDVFPCGDGGGITYRIPVGDYDVYATALDADGRVVGQSAIQEADIAFDGERVELGEFAFLSGQFKTTWLLTEENTGEPLTCSQVGAGGISFLSTLANSGGTAFDDEFRCPSGDTQGTITTRPLPLGDYTISVAVLELGSDGSLGEITAEGSLVEHAVEEMIDPFEFFFPEA